jgi:hypothetical protein
MITVKVTDNAVKKAMARLSRRMADPSPVMLAISEALKTQTSDNFSAQAGPLGKWPPLKYKRKGRDTNPQILTDSARLRNSITATQPALVLQAGQARERRQALRAQGRGELRAVAHARRRQYRHARTPLPAVRQWQAPGGDGKLDYGRNRALPGRQVAPQRAGTATYKKHALLILFLPFYEIAEFPTTREIPAKRLPGLWRT